MKRWIFPCWQVCLLLIWALWWGGLCFYAAVVVPTGTELIGGFEQGFITQRVTQWHNAILSLFVVALLIEWAARRSRSVAVIAIVLAVIDIALMAWHAHLTSLMNMPDRSLSSGFYSQHAVYLWLTAVEWVAGVATPFFMHWPQRMGSKLPLT